MTSSVSKNIENQFLYARFLASASQGSRERLAGALEARLGKKQSEHLLKGLDALLDLVARERAAFAEALSTTHEESSEDDEARRAVAEEQRALRQTIIEAREAIAAGFGQQGIESYGLDGRQPQSRERLSRYAHLALSQLEERPRTRTNAFGSSFDTAPIATTLRDHLERFDERLAALDLESRETGLSRGDRDLALDAFRSALVHTASILEATLRLGGLDGLADRVRPTIARVDGEEEIEGGGDVLTPGDAPS